ncbi:hypothetical protein [Nocardia sp. NPDC051750]|uniref:hypothetical protein n=1 Tax=Nocardia sp. NPDC051750 TaxID=3364325 RepID=UPI0037B54922
MLLVMVDRLEELRATHPYDPVNLHTSETGCRLVISGELSSAILFVYRLVHGQAHTDNGDARMRAALSGCRVTVDPDDGDTLLVLPSVMVAA